MVTNKYLSKIWTINVLLCVLSLFLYQYYTPKEALDSENLLAKFFNFGIDLFRIYWVNIFFMGMVCLSLTLFLNRIEAIINNPFLSFLTFLFIPTALIGYILIITVSSGDFLNSLSLIKDWLIPPIIYLGFTGVQFYLFRKNFSTKTSK